MRSTGIFTALALATVLGGCANTPAPTRNVQAALTAPYRLDSGDRLRVTVFEQESLTNTYAIDKGGFLSLPLIGTVPARGQTTDEIEAAIAERLRGGYLRDPNISVEVENYRPFYIMGEVTQGGQYSYFPGMTVQNAVAVAGGFSPRAQKTYVDLTRLSSGPAETRRVAPTEPIQPGDTVVVRERWF